MIYTHHKNLLLVAITSALAITGCASTPVETTDHLDARPMNQPKVHKVVAIGAASKTVQEQAGQTAAKNTKVSVKQKKSNVTTNKTEKKDKTVVRAVAKPVLKEQQVFTSINSDKIYDLTLMKGETYKSAIYRWFNYLGYKKIGTLLNEELTMKINAASDRDLRLKTTANKAVQYLIDAINNVELTEEQDKKLSLHNFVSNPDEKIHIEFTGEHEVVITTSQLPMAMFEVKKGDLLTNYLRLGAKYDWNVQKDFFLASNYEVPFDYIIVTEKGNINSALEQLLDSYPGLIAGTYEAKREIYIESVE